MDISTFLPGLADTNHVGLESTESPKMQAPKHGPAKVGFISAGQQRRAVGRARKAHSRKATKRNRREWHQTQSALATLRGQLQTMGLLPWADGECRPGNPATLDKVEIYLCDAWGDPEGALEAYQAATARR